MGIGVPSVAIAGYPPSGLQPFGQSRLGGSIPCVAAPASPSAIPAALVPEPAVGLPLEVVPIAPLVSLPLVTVPLDATTEPLRWPPALILPVVAPPVVLPEPTGVLPDVAAFALAPLVLDDVSPEPLEPALGEPPQAMAASTGASQIESLVGRMLQILSGPSGLERMMCARAPLGRENYALKVCSKRRYRDGLHYEEMRRCAQARTGAGALAPSGSLTSIDRSASRCQE